MTFKVHSSLLEMLQKNVRKQQERLLKAIMKLEKLQGYILQLSDAQDFGVQQLFVTLSKIWVMLRMQSIRCISTANSLRSIIRQKKTGQKGDLKLLEIPNFCDIVMESEDSPLERDRDQWAQFRTEGAEFVTAKELAKIMKEV